MRYESTVTKADMALMSGALAFSPSDNIPLRFTYGDKTVYGIPKEFSPTVSRRLLDTNMVQYVIDGEDESGLSIRAEYIEYRDYPVTEWVFFFRNNKDTDTALLKNIRIEGKLVCPEAVLEYGNGDTRREDGYTFFKKPVTESIRLTPTTGTSCEGAFPYMTLHGKDREIRAAIGWPTKWAAEISPTEDGVVFSCGQDRCATVLHPGETYRTPRLNLMVYTNDNAPYRGINLWRRFCFDHIFPRENGRQIPPKFCLHYWMAAGKQEMTGATEENQIDALNEYIRRGLKPDIWWFDAGWHPCNYEWHHTGTWKCDVERFPRGLAPLGEECEKNGAQLLLWFEPERVRAGTELYDEHPEWILSQKNADGSPVLNHLFNLGDSEALDWIIRRVDGIIKESHVSIYRQDFNFDPLKTWVDNEPEGRIGMLENLHAQGYLKYWDELLLRNPGLWIDSCASGGRRNDLESMRRAVTLHYTDVGYGNHPIKQKQHREMFEWIPYFRAHNMSWDNPDGTYGKTNKAATEYDYHCAFAPAITDMCWYNDTDERYELAKKMQVIWRRAAEIELSGDYYPITECRAEASDWYAMQFEDTVTRRGFVQAIRNVRTEDESFVALLPCIHDGATYILEDMESGESLTLSADDLKSGIVFTMPKRTGKVYFYTFTL